jgi:EmrB/QacA subfamily drug resistance transporter
MNKMIQFFAFATLMSAFFMAMLDSSIVNITLPMMTQYFQTSVKTVSWVSNGYNLAFAVLLITASRLADQFGRKKMFMMGLFFFTVMSYMCGISRSVNMLIFFRVLQGLACAFMVPVTLPLGLHIFPKKQGGAIIGVWASIAGLAIASGPALGGIISEKLAWQWIFFINVPIGIVTLILTGILLKESKDITATHWIDWSGMFSITGAAFSLTYALIEANEKGWGSVEILSLFVLSGICLLLFVIVEKKAKEPMLPLWLIRILPFSFGCITLLIIGMAMMNGVFFLSFYLTEVLGMASMRAGLMITALPLTSILFSAVSGPISDKIGSRWFAIPGMLLLVISVYLLSFLTPSITDLRVIELLMLMGAALGLTLTPITGACLRAIPFSKIGIGSGVGNMTRTIGSVLGVSIIVVLFTNAVDISLEKGKESSKKIVMESTVLKKNAKDIIVKRLDEIQFASESRLPSQEVIIALVNQKKEKALNDSPDFMQEAVEKIFEKQKKEAIRLYGKVQKTIKESISDAFSGTFKINSLLIIIGIVFAYLSEPGVDKKKHKKSKIGFHVDI